MRTTIELSDDQHVALRTLAARRGIRGFSPLISEAVDLLLASEDMRAVEAALALAGTLDDEEAAQLERRVGDLRGGRAARQSTWRETGHARPRPPRPDEDRERQDRGPRRRGGVTGLVVADTDLSSTSASLKAQRRALHQPHQRV